jgi:Protein of unknown function (DUF3667)
VKELVHEVVEVVTHVDPKALRTLGSLATKPGVMSAEYVSGKRTR